MGWGWQGGEVAAGRCLELPAQHSLTDTKLQKTQKPANPKSETMLRLGLQRQQAALPDYSIP